MSTTRQKYTQLQTETQRAIQECEAAKIAWQNAIDKKRALEDALMKAQEDLMMVEHIERQQEAIKKAKQWVPKTPLTLKTPGKFLKALDSTIEVDDEETVVDVLSTHHNLFQFIEYHSVNTGKHILVWINMLDYAHA